MKINKFGTEYNLLYHNKKNYNKRSSIDRIEKFMPIYDLVEFNELCKFIEDFSSNVEKPTWYRTEKYFVFLGIENTDKRILPLTSAIKFRKDILKENSVISEFYAIDITPIKDDYFIYCIKSRIPYGPCYTNSIFNQMIIEVGLEYVEDFNKILIRYIKEKVSLV